MCDPILSRVTTVGPDPVPSPFSLTLDPVVTKCQASENPSVSSWPTKGCQLLADQLPEGLWGRGERAEEMMGVGE